MMASWCEVFERTEKKYRLSRRQYEAMKAGLVGHMQLDAFGITDVWSLYLDTPERLLIGRSVDKPLYKEKLRVRRYGGQQANDHEDCVFIEIKKKYKGVVYKRRVGLSPAAAQAYLGGMPYDQACARFPLTDAALVAESTSARSLQIASEIDQFKKRYGNLVPSMEIACRRAAYEALDQSESELRITFDAHIAYRDRFSQSASRRELLMPGEVIMEVKNAGPWPTWLSHMLAACGAYPSSFSKYGAAYSECTSSDSHVPVVAAPPSSVAFSASSASAASAYPVARAAHAARATRAAHAGHAALGHRKPASKSLKERVLHHV